MDTPSATAADPIELIRHLDPQAIEARLDKARDEYTALRELARLARTSTRHKRKSLDKGDNRG